MAISTRYFINFSGIILLLTGFLASCQSSSAVQDGDGNIYHTVKIGNQVWMSENLKTTKFRNGDPVPELKENKAWASANTAAFCFYDNQKRWGGRYGLLYNWYVLHDKRGLAPEGWHVPTKQDISILLGNLKSDTLAAAILKKQGDDDWLPALIQTAGSVGFDALPAGYRYRDGSFHNLKSNAYFWTEAFSFEMYNWSPRLFSGFADVDREKYYRQYGFSIRCVKD